MRRVCAWPVQHGSHTTPRTVSPAGAGAAAPVGGRGRWEGGPGTRRMLPVAQSPGRCHLTRSVDRITGSRAVNGLPKGTAPVVRRGPLPRLPLPASRVCRVHPRGEGMSAGVWASSEGLGSSELMGVDVFQDDGARGSGRSVLSSGCRPALVWLIVVTPECLCPDACSSQPVVPACLSACVLACARRGGCMRHGKGERVPLTPVICDHGEGKGHVLPVPEQRWDRCGAGAIRLVSQQIHQNRHAFL